MSELIPRKEAAKRLGIGIYTLDELRKQGKISYVQHVANGRVFFTEIAIQEYLARANHRAKPMEKTETYRNRRHR